MTHVPDINLSSNFSENTAAPRHFTIERVTDPQSLTQEWEPLLHCIFPDEGDWEPQELLLERLANGEAFFLMRNEAGEAIGMELSQVVAGSSAMYIPWTGVLPEYRNLGIGADMNRTISAYMSDKYGVTHTLLDIEDPARMGDAGYSAEELQEAAPMAQRRINFWRREGFIIVDDEQAQSGDKLEYARPSSEDEREIQAYDHMAIRFDLDDPNMRRHMNSDGTAISRDFVRQCYLDMTRIQYYQNNKMSEDELRDAFPAVNHYLNNIDLVESPWLSIHTSAVKPKTSPHVATTMNMITEESANRPTLQAGSPDNVLNPV